MVVLVVFLPILFPLKNFSYSVLALHFNELRDKHSALVFFLCLIKSLVNSVFASAAPSSAFSFTAAAKDSAEETPKTPIESVFAIKQEIPAAPSAAEDEEPSDDPDDAYIPATDPADEPDEPTIFSYIPEDTEPQLSFGLDEPEGSPAPSSYESEGTSKGIFSGLSSSFLADLAGDLDVKETSSKEPERAVPEKPRSQLVAQTERSGLIVDGPSKDSVRAPSFTGEDADLAVRWTSVTSKLHGTNENIAVILERTKLRKEGDSAYVVFEDNDMKLLSNLKNSQSFRQISASIKDEFGADHLYLCTVTQYSNQE